MLTFVEYLEGSIKKHWDLPALTNYKENSITYAESAQIIKKFHNAFEQLDIKKGDKIAQIGRNNINWALTFFKYCFLWNCYRSFVTGFSGRGYC